MHELHKDDTHKPQMYRPEITSKRSASRFSVFLFFSTEAHQCLKRSEMSSPLEE